MRGSLEPLEPAEIQKSSKRNASKLANLDVNADPATCV